MYVRTCDDRQCPRRAFAGISQADLRRQGTDHNR